MIRMSYRALFIFLSILIIFISGCNKIVDEDSITFEIAWYLNDSSNYLESQEEEIKNFVIASKFPTLSRHFLCGGGGTVDVTLVGSIPNQNITLFSIEYGKVNDVGVCVLISNEAVGMRYNNKIGIIYLEEDEDSERELNIYNDGFGLDDLEVYDFDARDVYLLNEDIFYIIKNELDYRNTYNVYSKILYLLAKDEDTSKKLLFNISQELLSYKASSFGSEYGYPEENIYESKLLFEQPSPYDITFALLENPKVYKNKRILTQIMNILEPNISHLHPSEFSTYEEIESFKEREDDLHKEYNEVKSKAEDLLNNLR
tara:strand:- start:544 stop:1488 length:945 start_codon:yes stop_codon:yes gene_type:complete